LQEHPKSRVFHAYLTDWEKVAMFQNDPVAKARLIQKYKGLVFFDKENNLRQTMSSTELEWRRKSKGADNSYTGWYLVSVDENDEEWPWEIGDGVCEMLADCEQNACIEIIRKHQESEEEEDE
jgi:hypothetical protein